MSAPGLPVPPQIESPEGHLVLRPWRVADATALARAWAVPDIGSQAAVPGEGGVADAERWIRGAVERATSGRALDLVVTPRGAPHEVWGEVGLARLELRAGERSRPEVEVGWWVAPERRGRGVATEAVRLLVDWTRAAAIADRVVARIPRDNRASQAVAASAGLERLGRLDAHRDLWAGPVGRRRDDEV